MPDLQISADMIFQGSDIGRPRMTVEREKMAARFPQFNFYGSGVRISSVQGWLMTSYGGKYFVRVEIPEGYPYEIPSVSLPSYTIEPNCPHQYKSGKICLMRAAQWSSTLSLAVIVTKAAVWLNKYDSWRRNGCKSWPGKGQAH